MDRVKITIRPNGPYRVEDPGGVIDLVDAAGNKYDLNNKPAYSLCRCGASVNKPFCDGTHSKIGFQAAEAAVQAEGSQPSGQSPAPSQSGIVPAGASMAASNDPHKR